MNSAESIVMELLDRLDMGSPLTDEDSDTLHNLLDEMHDVVSDLEYDVVLSQHDVDFILGVN